MTSSQGRTGSTRDAVGSSFFSLRKLKALECGTPREPGLPGLLLPVSPREGGRFPVAYQCPIAPVFSSNLLPCARGSKGHHPHSAGLHGDPMRTRADFVSQRSLKDDDRRRPGDRLRIHCGEVAFRALSVCEVIGQGQRAPSSGPPPLSSGPPLAAHTGPESSQARACQPCHPILEGP